MASIPGGVADAERNVGYVAGLEGSIRCLDLATGEVIATSQTTGSPLAAAGGLVFGWVWASGPAFDIFALEQAGKRLALRWSQSVALPEWARPDALDRFLVTAAVAGSELRVEWQAAARYRGGAPPSLQIEAAAHRDESGTVLIDVGAGRLLAKRSQPGPAQPEREPPDAQTLIELGAAPYRQASEWVNRPWRVNETEMLLARSRGEPGLVLAAATGHGAVRLTPDPAAEPMLTRDGSLLFLHEPGSTEWKAFDAASGEPVTSVPFDAGTEDVSVIDGRIIYSVTTVDGERRHRQLRARRLDSGEALWSCVLEEGVIETPSPPPP